MRLTEVRYDKAQAVEGYGPGFFRIGGQVLHGPCLITPWQAISWAGPDDAAPILALLGQIDVLFLGMGADIAPAPRAFRSLIEDAGLGLEVMSSPAACRTYNVLLGEGRRIAAALLPVGAA